MRRPTTRPCARHIVHLLRRIAPRRGNIGNARLAGLEADLNMTPGDYALALSVFFMCVAVQNRWTG